MKLLLIALSMLFVLPAPVSSVGFIGGADGPTEIFIAGPQVFDWADVIAAGIVLVLGLIGYLLLRRLLPKKG